MEAMWRCPRCALPVARNEHGRWWCERDGDVAALAAPVEPSVLALLQHLERVGAPTWVPWPMPAQWSLAGVGWAADAAGEVQATTTACVGPDVISGTADLVIVCEEPAVGLGARYADVPGLDIATEVTGAPPALHIEVAGRATPLWWLGGRDRDVFVGEASGRWLWLITWPATSGAIIRDDLVLTDLHDLVAQLDMIPLSGPSLRL
jgi:hypothetical protein